MIHRIFKLIIDEFDNIPDFRLNGTTHAQKRNLMVLYLQVTHNFSLILVKTAKFLNGHSKLTQFVDRCKCFWKLCPERSERCKYGCKQTMAASVDSPSEITYICILNDKIHATRVVALSARELGTTSKNNLKGTGPTLRINYLHPLFLPTDINQLHK